jgi:hypothetical protein
MNTAGTATDDTAPTGTAALPFGGTPPRPTPVDGLNSTGTALTSFLSPAGSFEMPSGEVRWSARMRPFDLHGRRDELTRR